jgi:SAM-dependent methyltransferase
VRSEERAGRADGDELGRRQSKGVSGEQQNAAPAGAGTRADERRLKRGPASQIAPVDGPSSARRPMEQLCDTIGTLLREEPGPSLGSSPMVYPKRLSGLVAVWSLRKTQERSARFCVIGVASAAQAVHPKRRRSAALRPHSAFSWRSPFGSRILPGMHEPEERQPRPFYTDGGLNVETYDARTAGFPGEIDWWVRQALDAAGPVLELACGTGRVAWPVARAGVEIVGLDIAAGMLRTAEAKRDRHPREVSERVRFVRGDMTDFSLGETFALAIIPFRAFQALLTPEAQRSSLTCIRRHLRPGGRLIIDVFDPRLDLILPDRTEPALPDRPSFTHPVSGNVVTIEVLTRTNDPLRQILRERWRFTERSSDEAVVRREEEILELRWIYRYEMHYLLELGGFAIGSELSDFSGAPPAYGREQIWVAVAD